MIALNRVPIGPDKEAFHRYLTDFQAVDGEAELFDALYDCTDVLPKRYADLLFMTPGSTYRDAVRLLLSGWTSTVRRADDSSFV